MRYTISRTFLALVPEFHRGVVVARNASNDKRQPEIETVLASEWDNASVNALRFPESHVLAWDEVYKRFGANPAQHTPSIRFLLQQASRRKPMRSISPLVDLFNVISLRYGLPCGGDDLDTLDEGIELTLAQGGEKFSALSKPDVEDPPSVGEAIYQTVPSRRVMCRRLNWRNASFSRIQASTRNVAINVDSLVTPASLDLVRRATDDLAALVGRHCGGQVSTYFLSSDQSMIEL